MSRRTALGIPRAVAVTGLTAALVSGTSVQTAGAAGAAISDRPDLAARFVAAVNAERVANHRPRLSVSRRLTAVARRWAARMAARNLLAHDPGLAGQVRGWHYLGENVGVGYSVASLAAAFWASPEHRSNILDRHYTEVGVAVVEVDGKLWVAEEYERPYGASSRSAVGGAASVNRRSGLRPARTDRSRGLLPPNRCPLSM